MLKLNLESLEITCPQGDTGLLLARLTDVDGVPLGQHIDGVAIFAVCQKTKAGNAFNMVSSRAVEIVDNTATILITNALTRVITPGDYFWDIRIVTNPEYDETGNVIAEDDSDEVHSLFAGRPGGMPKFIVPGVAVDV